MDEIVNGIISVDLIGDEEWAYKQLYGDLFYCVPHYQNFHHQEHKLNGEKYDN